VKDATPAFESWKPIAGFEGLYEVSDQGNVRSVDRRIIRTDGQARRFKGKPLKPRTTNGVAKVSLSLGSIVRDVLVSHLVIEAFGPERPADAEWVGHRNGDPFDNGLSNLEYVTTSGRFWAQVDTSGDCWLWTGSDCGREPAYGRFAIGGRKTGAHRYAYENIVGPIPDGLELDHMCHTTLCVRPEHLRPTTHKQNSENFATAAPSTRTGVRGVSKFDRYTYRATVGHNGERVYAGLFRSLEDAEAAVRAQRLKFHTHNDLDRTG